MHRLALLLATAALATTCATAPPPAPPPPPPPAVATPSAGIVDCPTTSTCSPTAECPPDPVAGKLVEIVVDGNANASPSCVRIKKGNTTVVWTGADDVARLSIRFKPSPGTKPPKDPDCAGASCILSKAKQGLAHGEFEYEICVERTDGGKAFCDPKLIINP